MSDGELTLFHANHIGRELTFDVIGRVLATCKSNMSLNALQFAKFIFQEPATDISSQGNRIPKNTNKNKSVWEQLVEGMSGKG